VILTVLILFACSAYCTGESSFEVEIEADSNDISEHPHGVKPKPYLCTVCDKRFRTKWYMNQHKQILEKSCIPVLIVRNFLLLSIT